MSAKHHKPLSAEGWQTVWVTGTGTGVRVETPVFVEEPSGMIRVVPMDMLFGLTSGFAALRSSCEILNFPAILLSVSPASTI